MFDMNCAHVFVCLVGSIYVLCVVTTNHRAVRFPFKGLFTLYNAITVPTVSMLEQETVHCESYVATGGTV